MGIRDELTYELLFDLMVNKKMKMSSIARMFGVSRQRIFQIKEDLENKHGKIKLNNFIDVVTLKRCLDERMTLKEISKKYNLPISKINSLIKDYQEKYEDGTISIKVEKKKAEDILTKSLLTKHYLEELLTDKEIALKYHLSPATVNILRNKYEINTINTKALRQLPKKLSKEKFHFLYNIEGYTLSEIAEKYNCNIVSLIKLKENYGIVKRKKS